MEGDLFANDPHVVELLTRLDQVPSSELTAKWPKALSELVDILAAELTRSGMQAEQATCLSRRLAMVLAHYMGGRAYYIPTGDNLKAALRDRAIWDEFNGRNIDQLARKHGLSVPQTYAVVAEQRQLSRSRSQLDMFS